MQRTENLSIFHIVVENEFKPGLFGYIALFIKQYLTQCQNITEFGYCKVLYNTGINKDVN